MDMVLCLTKDKNARNIISSISKSSCITAGQNSYYMGIDRKTGYKRYLVERRYINDIKRKLLCEIIEV